MRSPSVRGAWGHRLAPVLWVVACSSPGAPAASQPPAEAESAAPVTPASAAAAASDAASAAPVEGSPPAQSAAPAPAVACHCFGWVHQADHGHECFPTRAACQQAKVKVGRPTTPCGVEQHERCRRIACRDIGKECFELR